MEVHLGQLNVPSPLRRERPSVVAVRRLPLDASTDGLGKRRGQPRKNTGDHGGLVGRVLLHLSGVASTSVGFMRKTGPSRATVDLVLDRASGCCERCEQQACQIHHRTPRGAGGSRSEAINSPSNLLALCYDCHRYVESNREESYTLGLLVRRTDSDTAAVPVRLLHGWCLLTATGTYEVVEALGQ